MMTRQSWLIESDSETKETFVNGEKVGAAIAVWGGAEGYHTLLSGNSLLIMLLSVALTNAIREEVL